MGLIPGLGRSSGGGNGNPLQYSYWENPMHRGLQSMGLQRGQLVTIEYPCMHIPTRLFHLPQIPITSPGCHLCFSPTGFRLEVPMIFSLSSINFLERLTELRETFYLLDYWFIKKGQKSETTKQKKCSWRKGMRHGQEHTACPKSPCIHQPRSSQTLSLLLGFYRDFITEA